MWAMLNQGGMMRPVFFFLLFACISGVMEAASATVLLQGADLPDLPSPQNSTSGSSASSTPGIGFWFFVAVLCIFALGIFAWVFREISTLFKPKRPTTSAFRRKIEKQYQQRHDEQTSLQEAVDDDN